MTACQTCGTEVTALAFEPPDDNGLLSTPKVFVPGGEYVARHCGHRFVFPAGWGVVVVVKGPDKCQHCGREIEHVEGVGWLHVDQRIYWMPQIEPQCAKAEPALDARST